MVSKIRGILLFLIMLIPYIPVVTVNTGHGIIEANVETVIQSTGTIVRIKASMIEQIIGVNPESILAAAYTSNGWVRLPIRIYNDMISNNMTSIYVMPEKIGLETIIETKLLPVKTFEARPEEDMPRFLRGGDGYIHLKISDPRLGETAHIYLFYDKRDKGYVYWSSAGYQHLYTVDYAHVADPFETKFAPTKSRVTGGVTIVEATPQNALIEVYGYPLPDGSGAPSYNLVEFRAQHTTYHLESDYILGYHLRSIYTPLQVLDPEAPPGVSWTRVRLTILVSPIKVGHDAVLRTLEVRIVETGEIRTYTIYPYKTNVIVDDIIFSLYGSSDRGIVLNISLHGIGSQNERWSVRLLPTVYLIWYNMSLGGPREKIYEMSLIDKAEIMVSLAPWDRTEERQIYLKNTRVLSIINHDIINTTLRISSLADPQVYPLRVSVYLDSVRLCSVNLYQPLEERLCTASLNPSTIVAIFSRDTPIPVTVRVLAFHSSYSTVRLYIDTVNPLEIRTRQMYLSLVHNIRILYTSTLDDYNPEWGLKSRLLAGGFLGTWTITQSSLLEGIVESRIAWDIKDEYQITPLEIVIDFSGVPSKTICDTNLECYSIAPIEVNRADITIFFDGVLVDPASVTVKGVGEPGGEVPGYPQLPPVLGIILSRTVFGQLYTAFEVLIWSIDMLAEAVEDDVNVDVDGWNVVHVQWAAGMLGGKEELSIKISMDVTPVSTLSECSGQVAVIKLYAGDWVYRREVTGVLCPP